MVPNLDSSGLDLLRVSSFLLKMFLEKLTCATVEKFLLSHLELAIVIVKKYLDPP